jgi:IS30 family transposase
MPARGKAAQSQYLMTRTRRAHEWTSITAAESTNVLLRQYLPKGTDLSRWKAEEIAAIAHSLTSRPRQTLG